MKSLALWGFALLAACNHTPVAENRKPQSTQEQFLVAHVQYFENQTLRVGAIHEVGALKACVIYLEGLGDSIRNHEPLFSRLSGSGYRVISFDYLGQGGSSGSMNSTRLAGSSSREIGQQARWFWNWYAKQEDGRGCANSPKLVIGWSTGGLAAYKLAHEKWADAVVLIAPGIHPNKLVGEAQHDITKALNAISLETLTRNRFSSGIDPHIDEIRPTSPIRVPLFAASLLYNAKRAQHWKIDRSVLGIVFLSGLQDTYVDSTKTVKTLKANAPHFAVKSYDGALHELDNEIPAVASDIQNLTVEFLDRVLESRR